MNLSAPLEKAYLRDGLTAREAQRKAEWIAFGPAVFQASRIMVKWGILEMLRNSDNGLTMSEIVERTGKTPYAIKVLMEASLCIGTVMLAEDREHFLLTKTGWCLLTDRLTQVNMAFNHDVNYEGWFRLEESLEQGRPVGLEHFGDWPTVYEGLSCLPPEVQDSWFGFDHFYSDSSFDAALAVVFGRKPRTLLDVGGNTGRWALRCVDYDDDVRVTIMDLPQQIGMMREYVAGKNGADRIDGYGINLLNPLAPFPTERHYDIIWMSQFLDCFGEDEIESILRRAAAIMDDGSRLCIMETFWDRQNFELASFCLTMTSLYFAAIANGNSKMYHSEDMERIVRKAGLEVEAIHDDLGYGHSIMVCRKKNE